jgi:tetratricopeptide (TPR) repeat protein
VFRGGFDRDAARAVAGAGPRELRSLQHRSLIERSQEGRFWSHELLRHFAEKKLVGEEAEKTRADHCAFYARSMDVWTDRIHGPEQMIALSGLRHEKLNLYAAWEWALERARVTELTRLLPGVLSTAGWISWERGSRRFFGAVEGALDRGIEKLSSIASPAARRLVARLLASQAFACFYRGDGKRASQRLASAKAALAEADVEGEDCRRERIRLLEVGAAILELGTGRTDAAATQLEEALELARGLGDRWQEASLLSALSRWALGPGIHLAPVDKRDRELALRRSEDALALFRELGAPHDIAEALMDIARLARLDDDLTTARARMEEARAIFTQADDRAGVAHAAGSLGRVLAMEGKLEEARSLLEESVALYAQEGAKPLAVFFRQRLAGVCARLGRYDEAEAHINEVLSFLADVEFYAEPEETRHAQVMKAAIALARGEPAEARRFLDNALSRPSRSPDPDELLLCAAVARKSGNGDEAARSLARAYARALEGGAPPFLFLVEFVAEAAFQLCERGETEQAVELYALATRDTPETPQLRDFGGLRIHDAAVRLGDHVAAAARDRGAAKDLPTAAREILHEIESRSATGRY